MRNVSVKSDRENQNTRFIFDNVFFTHENRAVYDNDMKMYGGPRQVTDDNAIRRRKHVICCRLATARPQTLTYLLTHSMVQSPS
jgi:hypothetical protein